MVICSMNSVNWRSAMIGDDATISTAAEMFRKGEWYLRMAACGLLQHIHSDLAVSTALELLRDEEDSTLRAFLATGLASQFAFEAVEPLRQLVIDGSYDDTYADLKRDLVVATTLMEVDFPEREQWKADVEGKRLEDEAQRLRLEKRRLEGEEQRARQYAEGYDNDEPEPAKIKIGRNDPCPCGSGKKFKKCCLNKQRTGDSLNRPIGGVHRPRVAISTSVVRCRQSSRVRASRRW